MSPPWDDRVHFDSLKVKHAFRVALLKHVNALGMGTYDVCTKREGGMIGDVPQKHRLEECFVRAEGMKTSYVIPPPYFFVAPPHTRIIFSSMKPTAPLTAVG